MAIAYRASATASNSSSSTVVINKPTGTVDGDVMICIINANTSSTTITPPAGWTLIRSLTTPFITANASTYYKVASSEGSSYTFTLSSSQRNSGIISSFSGADNSSPINVEDGQTNANATSTAPSITTTVDNCMLIYVSGYDDGASYTYTPPTGYTEAIETGAAAACELAYLIKATAGSTGSVDGTISGAVSNAAFHIALAPAGAGGGGNVKTVQTVAFASVKTVSGVAIASVKTIDKITTT